jgi:hypothetical protein
VDISSHTVKMEIHCISSAKLETEYWNPDWSLQYVICTYELSNG